MSAGEFQLSRYAAVYGDGTNIHPIQVQPETLSLTIETENNDPPEGGATSPISARVSGGRRQLGLNAHLVRIKFTDTPPTGYKQDGVIALPLLSAAIRTAAVRGAEGAYLGQSIEVVGNSPETVR